MATDYAATSSKARPTTIIEEEEVDIESNANAGLDFQSSNPRSNTSHSDWTMDWRQEASAGGAWRRIGHLSNILLCCTVIVTGVATTIACASIMTDYWEYVSWNSTEVITIADAKNGGVDNQRVTISTYLDGLVIKLTVTNQSHDVRRLNGTVTRHHNHIRAFKRRPNTTDSVYLVPMNGGIWTLCVFLDGKTVVGLCVWFCGGLNVILGGARVLGLGTPENQLQLLKTVLFPNTDCINYLSTKLYTEDDVQQPFINWKHKMQNISISCALVCLILLACAALVGAFSIWMNQLSAILITGFMYLLAGIFALFTVTIVYYKRADMTKTWKKYRLKYPAFERQRSLHSDLLDEGVLAATPNAAELSEIWKRFYTARVFTTGGSFDLAIVAVSCSILASILWILLAKVMRYVVVGYGRVKSDAPLKTPTPTSL